MQLLTEQARRLSEERESIAALSSTATWLVSYKWTLSPKPDYDLCVEAALDINGVTRLVRLVYPTLFPSVPAYVTPVDATERWSREHQYGRNGAFCLEYGADSWTPSISGAQVLQSCADLLLSETEMSNSEPVESRHEVTTGQELRFSRSRFVLTTNFLSFVNHLADGQLSKFAAASRTLDGITVAFPTEAGIGSNQTFDDVPKSMSERVYRNWIREGFFIAQPVHLPETLDYSALKEVLQKQASWPLAEPVIHSIFIGVRDQESKIRIFSAFQHEGEDILIEYGVIDASAADASRLPDEFVGLKTKTVAILGLGSVGSKIAVSLARSGVENFFLVDDDIFMPANLVRNQLDWMAVGFAKVKAVEEEIKKVSPQTVVRTRTQRLAGQENSEIEAATFEKIGAADLVIDATANPRVWIVAAAVCHRTKTPLIWGELFAGGIGALMARAVPGVDAPPNAVREAVHAYLATLPPAPFMKAQGYDAMADGTPLLASDADVSLVAASMTQFALDVMNRGSEPTFPHPAYLMGYKKDWAFRAPFDTHPIDCVYLVWDQPKSDWETEPGQLEFIKEVFRNAQIIDFPKPDSPA